MMMRSGSLKILPSGDPVACIQAGFRAWRDLVPDSLIVKF